MQARNTLRIAAALAAAMTVLSVAAVTLRPVQIGPPNTIGLEARIPERFGSWRKLALSAQVIDPATDKTIKAIYTELVSRVYENDRGSRVMLSVAYVPDQRGGLQVHKPEICYPAQGFKVAEQFTSSIATSWGSLDVVRLRTGLGPRLEPVTYWIASSGRVIGNQLERRLVEFQEALKGQIPDGLIFRVSTIDANAPHAFAEHEAFIGDLLGALSPDSRRRLAGLSPIQP